MKPVVIIAIVAVVCSVGGVFGYSFYEYDRIQGQIANIEQYQIDSITCEIFIMENGLPQGIGEYSQECLDFKSLPVQEQYKIVEKEKQQQYLDSDRPCGNNLDESNCNPLRTNTKNAYVVAQNGLETLKYRDEVIVDKDFPWYELQKGDMFVYNQYGIDSSPMRQNEFEQGHGYKVGRIVEFRYDYQTSPKTIKQIIYQHDQGKPERDGPANWDTGLWFPAGEYFEKIYFGKVIDYVDTGIWKENTKRSINCVDREYGNRCSVMEIERLCSTWKFNEIKEIESVEPTYGKKQVVPNVEYDEMCIKKYTGNGAGIEIIGLNEAYAVSEPIEIRVKVSDTAFSCGDLRISISKTGSSDVIAQNGFFAQCFSENESIPYNDSFFVSIDELGTYQVKSEMVSVVSNQVTTIFVTETFIVE